MPVLLVLQPGGLTDEEEEQSETEADVPPAKEAFMSSDYVDDGAKTTTDRHVYDGYELLLDIDESVLDTYLPPPSGQCYVVLCQSTPFPTVLLIVSDTYDMIRYDRRVQRGLKN